MANIKSAAKRALQSEKRRARNASVQTGLKSAQRKLNQAVAEGNKEQSAALAKVYASALDKAAKRGIIHPNVADRKKSRTNKALSKAA